MVIFQVLYTEFSVGSKDTLRRKCLWYTNIDNIEVSNIIFVLKDGHTLWPAFFLSNAGHDLIFVFQRLSGMYDMVLCLS